MVALLTDWASILPKMVRCTRASMPSANATGMGQLRLEASHSCTYSVVLQGCLVTFEDGDRLQVPDADRLVLQQQCNGHS